jgi:uncharacterized protein
MKNFFQKYGEWALVAGAADGIGAAFSECLAQKGMNIVMVDKNETLLQNLSEKLEKKFTIRTVQVCFDLSVKSAWNDCMDAILPYNCRLLVYVPAYSLVRPFLENTENDLDLFLNLNCRTLSQLILAFANSIKNNKPAGIMIVSSLAGLIGPLYSAAYAGTKAFSILLTEALHPEFKDKNIDISVCCTGITDTPTYWSSMPDAIAGNSGILQPTDVAQYALKKLGEKTICIPGWKNRLIYFFLLRILPRKVAARIVSNAMVKMYPGK